MLDRLSTFQVLLARWLGGCWPYLMGWSAIYVGIGYAFGPDYWYSTPSLELVRRFVVPVPVWGLFMIASGLLILSRKWEFIGHFIAMLLWAFWFFCIAVSAGSSILAELFGYHGLPPISGWGAPAYVLVYATLHAYMLKVPTTRPPKKE